MIRAMRKEDEASVMEMMEVFYASEAVMTNGSREIFQNDIAACLSDNPYLEGYVFAENGELQGYAMLAKSFSTEFGKPCIWIEDIYLKESHRGKGLGQAFFQFLEEQYPRVIFRLEAEEENETAVALYRKQGFRNIPYYEMIKR